MGSTFELITDEALRASDADVYPYCDVCWGYDRVFSADGVADQPAGPKGAEVTVACAHCLKAGLVRHTGERLMNRRIEEYLERMSVPEEHGRLASLVRREQTRLRQTPRIPRFPLETDWPLCCRSLAEYVGSPRGAAGARRVQESAQYWEIGAIVPSFDLRDSAFAKHLHEVSVFRCNGCGLRYWVFQFTG